VLRQVTDSPPRSWTSAVQQHGRATRAAVERRLEADRVIRAERHRLLGFIPVTRVTVRQALAVRRIRDHLAAVMSEKRPISQVDPHDAALVALVVAGDLRIAMPRGERSRRKRRIAELSARDRVGPAPAALRRVIQRQRSAAAGG